MKFHLRSVLLYVCLMGVFTPEMAEAGYRPSTEDSTFAGIASILEQAVRDSVFPGAVATVIKDGSVIYQQAVGFHTYDKRRKMKTNDVFDMASITKIVSTTTAAMKLVSEGKLDLDAEVRQWVPEFDTESKKHITIRHLLLHESGLPAFRVYVDSLQQREDILNAIRNEPLIYEPGDRYVYSDLGMILLAEIVSRITALPIDIYMRRYFYFPMGMNSTFFNPKTLNVGYTYRIPPTERDTVFRHKLIQAEVHDERAWYLDGVAGHAGLFSSANDLAKYCILLMNGGYYNGQQFLDPVVVETFTAMQSEQSGRGYGFDRRSRNGFTTAGSLSSEDTFGHTGFTGTSFWIDREKNVAIILLTNRTYPYRSFGKTISKIRAAVADAAFSALITP